jgi:hypothetical protein
MRRLAALLLGLLITTSVTLWPQAAMAAPALTTTFSDDCKDLTVTTSGYDNPPVASMWLRWTETVNGVTSQQQAYLPINDTWFGTFDTPGVAYSGFSIRPVDANQQIIDAMQDRAFTCLLRPSLRANATCTQIDWNFTNFGDFFNVTIEVSVGGQVRDSFTGPGSKTAPVTGSYPVPAELMGQAWEVRSFWTDFPTAASGIRSVSGTLPACELTADPPVASQVCGPNNDTVVVAPLPTQLTATDTGWVNGTRTITYSVLPQYVNGYLLTSPAEHTFTDDAQPCLIELGSTVWNDTDRDGTRDSGEPGIGGVTVLLLDSAGDEVDRTVTAADGSYLFSVVAGDYRIEIVAPSGYTVTTVAHYTAGDTNDLTLNFGLAVVASSSTTTTASTTPSTSLPSGSSTTSTSTGGSTPRPTTAGTGTQGASLARTGATVVPSVLVALMLVGLGSALVSRVRPARQRRH